MDTQFYDGGVTGNTNNHWYNYGNRLSVSVDNTGTLLTSLNSQYGYYYPIQPSDEITDANSYWFDTFIMEFDIVSTSSTSNEIVMYNPVDPTTYISISYVGLTTSGGHIKIVYDGSNVKVFANDVLTVNFTKVFNQKFRVGFDVHPNESLKYKNFVIYPI